MDSEIPEMPKFPHIDVLPIVDRIVDAGLWVGRLITKRHLNVTPSDHFVRDPMLDYPDHTGDLPDGNL